LEGAARHVAGLLGDELRFLALARVAEAGDPVQRLIALTGGDGLVARREDLGSGPGDPEDAVGDLRRLAIGIGHGNVS